MLGKRQIIKQQRSKLHNQEFYTLFTAVNVVGVNQLTRTWPEKVALTAPSSSLFVLSNAQVHVHARVRRPHFTHHISSKGVSGHSVEGHVRHHGRAGTGTSNYSPLLTRVVISRTTLHFGHI